MTRFFVTPEELQPDFLVLTGENAKHAKVLRLKNGEDVLVCDGQGSECLCTVSDVSEGQISLVVRHRQQSETEAAVTVLLTMYTKAPNRMDRIMMERVFLVENLNSSAA